ncbi:MAG TPA: hypothetical protein VMR06_09275 [Dokdonella sp.]|uniref:hypothetical protein n=1 Tax=Dokdonella sp. TaxID=2291710 RepID=UPI002C235193|nr:hypothetical protein [Dokdonella sp.]HUD42169.1 hypothetical protein [Dokdonella sp.]
MKRIVAKLLGVLFVLLIAVPVLAKDVRDGQLSVEPARDDRFSVNGFTMGKAELYGYLSELKSSEGLQKIVLKRSKKASDAQRSAIGSIARALELEAVDADGADLRAPQP